MTDEIEDRARRFTWDLEDIELGYSGLANIFRSDQSPRDKFLSRLFGLFSEDVVRDWCEAPESPYAYVGRPTLFAPGEMRGFTLDFALQPAGSDGIFVSEMKCELEFERYRYLTLESADQLDHHRSPAFLRFLELSADPERYEVRVAGKPQRVLGTVLVWGVATEAGKAAVRKQYGVTEVLAVDELLLNLHAWGDATPWPQRIEKLRTWSNGLFDELTGKPAGWIASATGAK
jgi:hypothetical protein